MNNKWNIVFLFSITVPIHVTNTLCMETKPYKKSKPIKIPRKNGKEHCYNTFMKKCGKTTSFEEELKNQNRYNQLHGSPPKAQRIRENFLRSYVYKGKTFLSQKKEKD